MSWSRRHRALEAFQHALNRALFFRCSTVPPRHLERPGALIEAMSAPARAALAELTANDVQTYGERSIAAGQESLLINDDGAMFARLRRAFDLHLIRHRGLEWPS